MTTNDVVAELGDKWWPLPPEKFFTAQRAPDMWFGDELPPTLQDEMRSPLVTQSKLMLSMQIRQQLAASERQRIAEAQQRRYAAAVAKIGGRKRH